MIKIQGMEMERDKCPPTHTKFVNISGTSKSFGASGNKLLQGLKKNFTRHVIKENLYKQKSRNLIRHTQNFFESTNTHKESCYLVSTYFTSTIARG